MIARGAALFAMLKWTQDKEQSILQKAAVNKVTHDFGVAVKESGTNYYSFKMLIPEGAELPCKITEHFSTETDFQETLKVIIGRRHMYERETAVLFSDDAIEAIDTIEISNLPKARAFEQDIAVTFEFDSIGNLSVSVKVNNQEGQTILEQDLVKHIDAL